MAADPVYQDKTTERSQLLYSVEEEMDWKLDR